MDAEIILTIVIIVTILLLFVLHVAKYRSGCKCGCGCGCCTGASECVCGCKWGRCRNSADINMEITGPYELEQPAPVGTRVIAGIETQPIMLPSRTSHVGSWEPMPPRIMVFTEPIYSQHGDGDLCVAPHEDCYKKNAINTDTRVPTSGAEHFVDQINNTRRIYLHYTNWCGYCKKMKPIWAQVKETLADTALEFHEIDEDIAKTPGVNGYPTIIMIDENGFRHQYPGGIDFEKLRSWCASPSPPQKTH